ncbi:MAG: AAA family ATPase [bacterium]|nr:AAA family ATPase [bacterium]
MNIALDTLTIKGFKSIQSLEEFKLKKLNILIGGNGAGKSNFIDFFRLMRAMMELSLPELYTPTLQSFITDGGGIDDFLFNGPKTTNQIEIELFFGDYGYRFKLAPTADENVLISEEAYYNIPNEGWQTGGSAHRKFSLKDKNNTMAGNSLVRSTLGKIYNAVESWRIYHFHDTGKTAAMRRSEIMDDNTYLRFDAANIAPFLLRLKEEETDAYNDIVKTIRLVTPFFHDFELKPDKNEKVRLNWKQKGSDYPMRPHLFSDGTIRFICLTTALLQPDPPGTMIIDEPELGLHPYALEILAEMMEAVSHKTQIIAATQSPALVNLFQPENIIVTTREQGASVFKRLEAKELTHWLEDYSLGDLWQKNIIAGGPVHEKR